MEYHMLYRELLLKDRSCDADEVVIITLEFVSVQTKV